MMYVFCEWHPGQLCNPFKAGGPPMADIDKGSFPQDCVYYVM